MSESYPAPWDLVGKGYIIIYKFKPDFVNEQGRIPAFLKGKFSKGIGSVMIVDYYQSNAGPYQELLFIPGSFKTYKGKYKTISKIYVSTEESVVNGRKNWAIPKEIARFKFNDVGKNKEEVHIQTEDEEIMKIKFKSKGIKFPVHTKLMPFPLIQLQNDKYYFTKFTGKGWGRLSRIKEVNINAKKFPNISRIRPIAVIKVEPFSITFPVAETESNRDVQKY